MKATRRTFLQGLMAAVAGPAAANLPDLPTLPPVDPPAEPVAGDLPGRGRPSLVINGHTYRHLRGYDAGEDIGDGAVRPLVLHFYLAPGDAEALHRLAVTPGELKGLIDDGREQIIFHGQVAGGCGLIIEQAPGVPPKARLAFSAVSASWGRL